MKKGSITVFLSLILVLIFSFVLTTLEAARIRGATAYVSMVTELAGDSFLASYYYPLFQNYRLFGVDAGDEEGFFSEDSLVEGLEKNITYGVEEQKGGLFSFQDTTVKLIEYDTLLSGGEKEFLSQIRQQAVLDGLSLALQELFPEELFTEAGVVGEVYREQEEAMEVTATVTKELLKLMELVDGIRMKDNGIAFDKNGKMQAKDAFIKQLVPMEQGEVKELYDSNEVFRTVSGKFYQPDRAAGRIQNQLAELARLAQEIAKIQQRISEYQNQINMLSSQLEAEKERLSKQEHPDMTTLLVLQKSLQEASAAIERESKQLKEYENQRKSLISAAESEYNVLNQKLQAVRKILAEAVKIAKQIEKKQAAAKIAVVAYEDFLERIAPKLSEELYQVFLGELEKMKLYAGLNERGISVKTIQQSIQINQSILETISLSGFSEEKLERVAGEMTIVIQQMQGYTAEGLWFPYGNIVVVGQTVGNVMDVLGELLTTGILELVGVSKEEQSERELTGVELPSAGLEQENILKELVSCIEEIRTLFYSGGIGEVIAAAANAFLDETALELYAMKYFHSYGEDSPYTKLNYEREYLVFGSEKDKSNLLSVVLHLVAVRVLLCMVMLLKQPEKMAKLDLLSAGVVGFTGIPVLAAVVKYGALLLWSVEEALVEVAALLQGKRIAVIGRGEVELGDLFLMNKEMIEQKAGAMPEGAGASYGDYLTLLSLTRNTKKKAYRALDLIQENIRYRYQDNFRIRNLITRVSFGVETKLQSMFDTGIFLPAAYEVKCREEAVY